MPRLYRLIVACAVGMSAVVFLRISTAYAHDLKRPELNNWLDQKLTSDSKRQMSAQ